MMMLTLNIPEFEGEASILPDFLDRDRSRHPPTSRRANSHTHRETNRSHNKLALGGICKKATRSIRRCPLTVSTTSGDLDYHGQKERRKPLQVHNANGGRSQDAQGEGVRDISVNRGGSPDSESVRYVGDRTPLDVVIDLIKEEDEEYGETVERGNDAEVVQTEPGKP